MAEVFDNELNDHQEDMSKTKDCILCGASCSDSYCSYCLKELKNETRNYYNSNKN